MSISAENAGKKMVVGQYAKNWFCESLTPLVKCIKRNRNMWNHDLVAILDLRFNDSCLYALIVLYRAEEINLSCKILCLGFSRFDMHFNPVLFGPGTLVACFYLP